MRPVLRRSSLTVRATEWSWRSLKQTPSRISSVTRSNTKYYKAKTSRRISRQIDSRLEFITAGTWQDPTSILYGGQWAREISKKSSGCWSHIVRYIQIISSMYHTGFFLFFCATDVDLKTNKYLAEPDNMLQEYISMTTKQSVNNDMVCWLLENGISLGTGFVFFTSNHAGR